MREAKDNTFKFSSSALKKAQERLREKDSFKVNQENRRDYEEFILKLIYSKK